MEMKRTHPLIIVAAVAIILACVVAIASMTGLLPNSQARMSEKEIAQMEEEKEEARLAEEEEARLAEEEEEKARLAEEREARQAAREKAAAKRAAAQPDYHAPVKTAATCNNCGRVVDVRQHQIQGEGSGVGAVAGGVVGGLLGNQVGGGNGQKVATAAGVLGGAFLGNKIEKDRKSTTQYDVVVQFDDGGSDVFKFKSQPGWQTGDRVKVVNGQIRSN